MPCVYIDRITVKQFLDHHAPHQKVIALAREQEMTALAEKLGLTLRELPDNDGNKRKLVAPKYANPDDPSQT